jgi:hypothetical protein
MKHIILLICLILAAGAGIMAQDEEVPEECETETVAATLEEFAADEELDLDTVIDELLALRAGCSGLSWNSEDEGLNTVLGPIVIEAGFYRVSLASDDTIQFEVTALDDGCFDMYMGLVGDEAKAGGQEVFESEGCEALLQVDGREPWTVTFEKLR